MKKRTESEHEELKQHAAALHAAGFSFKDIAIYCGVTFSPVNYWLNPEYRSQVSVQDIEQRREFNRLWRHSPEYKEWEKEWRAKQYATDPQVKIARLLRDRLYSAFKSKHGSVVSDLGCTVAELKRYLESRFWPGMGWNNFGEWEIDHIKPLTSFDLTDRAQLLEAANWRNLQPLWAADNVSKGARLGWQADPLRRHPSERGLWQKKKVVRTKVVKRELSLAEKEEQLADFLSAAAEDDCELPPRGSEEFDAIFAIWQKRNYRRTKQCKPQIVN